jgi:hypothetical protein
MKKLAIAKYLFLLFVMAVPGVAIADSRQTELIKVLTRPSSTSGESQKLMIGEVEDIVLVPWAVTLPARIDTGAAMSSLDARNISVRNNVVDFRLGEEHGGLRLQLPVVSWSQIRNSMGSEKRPVVEISICLGSKLIHTLATLKDRSQMAYPFLVGRNVLNGSFVVDTSRAKAVTSACSSGSLARGTGDVSIN